LITVWGKCQKISGRFFDSHCSAGTVHKDAACGGEVFNEDVVRVAPRNTHIDSLESTARPRSADDSLQLADRISCLESDVAAKTYEIEALREQASPITDGNGSSFVTHDPLTHFHLWLLYSRMLLIYSSVCRVSTIRGIF